MNPVAERPGWGEGGDRGARTPEPFSWYCFDWANFFLCESWDIVEMFFFALSQKSFFFAERSWFEVFDIDDLKIYTHNSDFELCGWQEAYPESGITILLTAELMWIILVTSATTTLPESRFLSIFDDFFLKYTHITQISLLWSHVGVRRHIPNKGWPYYWPQSSCG